MTKGGRIMRKNAWREFLYIIFVKRLKRILSRIDKCDMEKKRIDIKQDHLLDKLNDLYVTQSWYNSHLGIYR